MFLLGYDVGSSSIKATLLDAATGAVIASASSPETEMEIHAPRPGWAEQDPKMWWDNIKAATSQIKKQAGSAVKDIKAIGISYQMHGLVIVDKAGNVLRPSIIWCDSRAVSIGDEAEKNIGSDICSRRLLNSPGNFTASKLKWVKDNEPKVYENIFKAMLPGDYIAYRMTGDISTTPSGLSEGIMWDFEEQGLADLVLSHYGISSRLIPDVTPTFSIQGEITKNAAKELGLSPGIKISYRAGDQPNNALSLNVLNPGEAATTAGTSGVIYGVEEKPNSDPRSRVNVFVHVNHEKSKPRYGVLLCVNGTGSLNRWLKNTLSIGSQQVSYENMNALAGQAPIGAHGLVILPYGNGAERTLGNRDIGASVHNLNMNIHSLSHVLKASQEGIVFALNYGLEIMRSMGLKITTVKAGHANMFLSPLFREAFATVTGAAVELYNTDGSQGAARGAGLGAGIYKKEDAFIGLKAIKTIEPDIKKEKQYCEAYERWRTILQQHIKE
jgi:xylulokinase